MSRGARIAVSAGAGIIIALEWYAIGAIPVVAVILGAMGAGCLLAFLSISRRSS